MTRKYKQRACLSTADRFWSKVDKSATPGGCWLWTGALFPTGYGKFNDSGRTAYAHRIAHQLSIGPIPDGMHVCHRCDVPACVNPAHLFTGTAADNYRDMVAKGRDRHVSPLGEANGKATKSFDVVQIARRMLAAGLSTRRVAALVGISQHSAMDWKRGRTRRTA